MSTLSEKYDRAWVKDNSLSGNVLLSLQTLLEKIPITKNMTVLDLACGKGVTSVCLAREFQARVFAVDKDIDATTNFLFFLKNDATGAIPLKASARNLPFPHAFFDVILITNSYGYFGTDDKFLPYITQFLKKNGRLGIVDICFSKEINELNEIPAFLQKDFHHYWYHVHSPAWWRSKFEKAGVLKDIEVEVSDKSDQLADDYVDFTRGKPDAFAAALQKDATRLIRFFTAVGTKNDRKPFLEQYSPYKANPNYPDDLQK